MSQFYQDWEPVVFRKSQTKSTDSKEKQVNIARRLGTTVVTTSKCKMTMETILHVDDAGKNKSVTSGPVLYARKVEEQDEVFTLPKVDLSFRLRLQKARTAKQMSQKDLAVVRANLNFVIVEIKCESLCDSRLRVRKSDSQPRFDLQDGTYSWNQAERE